MLRVATHGSFIQSNDQIGRTLNENNRGERNKKKRKQPAEPKIAEVKFAIIKMMHWQTMIAIWLKKGRHESTTLLKRAVNEGNKQTTERERERVIKKMYCANTEEQNHISHPQNIECCAKCIPIARCIFARGILCSIHLHNFLARNTHQQC